MGDEVDAAIDNIEQLPGVDHVSVGLDLLGFYWPKGERTALGVVMNLFGDRYEIGGSHLQLSGITVSFSAMHFLTETIGRGFFLRGDIGPARLAVDSDFGDLQSDWGLGVLAGAGYGLNTSPGTRLLFNANVAARRIEGDTVGTFAITLGGLF